MKIKSKLFLLVLFPAFVVFGLITNYSYLGNRSAASAQIKEGLSEKAQNYASRVDSLLNQASSLAITTAHFLTVNESMSEAALYEVLRHNIGDNQLIYGAAIAFEPGVFEGRKLFSPYVFREGRLVKSIDIGIESYDYTQTQWDWYNLPKKRANSVWTEPYFDAGAGNINMVTFSVPFYRNARVAGVATVDIDLSQLLTTAGVPPQEAAGLVIISNTGRIVHHANPANITKLSTEVDTGLGSLTLAELVGQKGSKFLDARTAQGQALWVGTSPLTTPGWSLALKLAPEVALRKTDEVATRTAFFTFAVLILGTLTAWWLIGRIVLRPLSQLAKAADEVTQGNLSVTLAQGGKDEIGLLSNNFQAMTRRLSEREQSLMGVNQELESRVAQAKVLELELREGRAAAQKALRDLQNQKFALDQHAIVSVIEADGIVSHVNDRFIDITGYSREEVVGKPFTVIHNFRQNKDHLTEFFATVKSGKVWQREVCELAKDGSTYWVDVTIVPFLDETGEPQQYIAIRNDITARKASEAQNQKLAFFDVLTQLPNRRMLLDRLQHALDSCDRTGRNGGLLFIDLDNFKIINDTLGHDVGDSLLKQVAQRLLGCVRRTETVARLGGDEFVVMLEDLSTDPMEAAKHIELVGNKILQTLNQPYVLGGREYQNTPSIGIALFADQGASVDELMKRADIAMYQAKKTGRNTIRFFDPVMQAAVESRSEMDLALRRACDLGQLRLFYQVQVNEHGTIGGAEVLLRWQLPDQSMVSPAQFIPLAEETGLIVPIGLWVLKTACEQLKRWQSMPDRQHLQLAVNVSARQFRQPDFCARVCEVLDQTGVNPHRLKLELTESLVPDNVTETIAVMQVLKDRGVQFSMDDFGTGHSSLSSLKKLPLDQLKIDQSFVRDIASDPDDAAIVQTIIAMANSLGMQVIAEGVETLQQREFLIERGCLNFQGYLFGKPVPLADFERQLEAGPILGPATSPPG